MPKNIYLSAEAQKALDGVKAKLAETLGVSLPISKIVSIALVAYAAHIGVGADKGATS